MDLISEGVTAPALSAQQCGQLEAIFARRIAIYRLKKSEKHRQRDDIDYGELVEHTIDAIQWLASECGLDLPDEE